MAKKVFFYRIDAGDLLDFATNPEGENMTVFQFAKELKKGSSDIPFIQGVIEEANGYIEKKKNAAHKRWDAPHMQNDAPHMQIEKVHMPEAVTEAVTEAVQKQKKEPKDLSASGDAVHDYYETRKKRKLTGERLSTFLQFWNVFGDKNGKAEAADAWYDLKLTQALLPQIMAGAEKYAKVIRPQLKSNGMTPKMAQGWLSGRRWEDETEEVIEGRQESAIERMKRMAKEEEGIAA